MTRKRRARIDPLERGIETALVPRHFVSYSASFDFVRDLGQVERDLERLIPAEPTRAVALYAGNGTMVDEPQTYNRPSVPAGRWTHAYARVDLVGQQFLGYYRFGVTAVACAAATTAA